MINWRKTTDYRIWAIQVKLNGNYKCKICGSSKNINAHHLNHATYFPNLRFVVDNGVCLCQNCHMNFHCNFKNSYREKCTEKDYNNFVVLMQYAIKMTTEMIIRQLL